MSSFVSSVWCFCLVRQKPSCDVGMSTFVVVLVVALCVVNENSYASFRVLNAIKADKEVWKASFRNLRLRCLRKVQVEPWKMISQPTLDYIQYMLFKKERIFLTFLDCPSRLPNGRKLWSFQLWSGDEYVKNNRNCSGPKWQKWQEWVRM